jgi:hypothetical protein
MAKEGTGALLVDIQVLDPLLSVVPLSSLVIAQISRAGRDVAQAYWKGRQVLSSARKVKRSVNLGQARQGEVAPCAGCGRPCGYVWPFDESMRVCRGCRTYGPARFMVISLSRVESEFSHTNALFDGPPHYSTLGGHKFMRRDDVLDWIFAKYGGPRGLANRMLGIQRKREARLRPAVERFLYAERLLIELDVDKKVVDTIQAVKVACCRWVQGGFPGKKKAKL